MRKSLVLLLLCLVAVFIGCQTTTTESDRSAVNTGTWQCRSAPDLHISVIDYTDELAYCEIFVGSEVGAFSIAIDDLANMLADRYCQRVFTREPLLGPPPPDWANVGLSDRHKSPRIDGTPRVPMYIHQPLPVHDQIHNTETISSGE